MSDIDWRRAILPRCEFCSWKDRIHDADCIIERANKRRGEMMTTESVKTFASRAALPAIMVAGATITTGLTFEIETVFGIATLLFWLAGGTFFLAWWIKWKNDEDEHERAMRWERTLANDRLAQAEYAAMRQKEHATAMATAMCNRRHVGDK